MDAKINTFCRSSFSKHEKRAFLFPVKPRLCHTCQKQKAKKHINFDNFSNYHQHLICMCVLARHPAGHGGGASRDHDDAAPEDHDDVAPEYHDDAAPEDHGGAAPGGHGGAAPGGHGGGHYNFVTIAQFTAFQIQITNSINQINNNINNILNRLNNNNII